MPLIVDPDLLNQGVEVTLNTGARTIALNVAGNLSADGASIKALYSFLKEEWKDDAVLPPFPFPMVPITDEFFELVDGWDMANGASRDLIRNGGWLVRNIAGNVVSHFAGVQAIGAIEPGDQLYYDNGAGAVDFAQAGPANQAIQIVRDDDGDGVFAEGSDFDRSAVFALFSREQGKTFAKATLSDIGVADLKAPKLFSFAAGAFADLKIATADIDIDANADGVPDIAPYGAMTITYHGTPQVRSIGGVNHNFHVIINGAGASAERIYEFVQFQLRQNLDIDAGAGSVIGKTADELLDFVGDTLKTKRQLNGDGVFIDNFDAADINRMIFVDDGGVERSFPFTASVTLQFNANLQNDPSAKYFVYFTALAGVGDDFGEAGAVLVDDGAGADMTGLVNAQASISHAFDYDGNAQGGRTPGTDAAVTVVAIGLDTAQYVVAPGVIQRSTSNQVSLVAPLERNYENLV